MKLKKITVVGSGIMGSGIAQVCALSGYSVYLQDISEDALKRSRDNIEKSLGKLAGKGKIKESEMKAGLANIRHISSLQDACKDADLIIEAVFEDIKIKHEVFKKIEGFARPDAIFASNTSALSITEIAGVVKRGDKFIGLHFMNPVPLMKGMEMIRGSLTSDETFETCWEFAKSLGKDPVEAVDFAGFIVSRLLDVLMNEAVKLVQEGNRPEDIDKAMELCAGHPMGPCKLLDLVGLEIAMHGMETMEQDFGDRYKPHPLLKKMVMAGHLGKKTGRGLYNYSE